MNNFIKSKLAVIKNIIALILIAAILFSVIFLFSPKITANPGNPSLLLFFDGTSTPSGWTDVSSDFEDKFIRASDTYGGTGGQSTHTHTASVTVGATTDDTAVGQSTSPGTGYNTVSHTHTGSASVNETSNLPTYRTLKIIKYNGIPSTVPQGAIAIFNASCPTGWTTYSEQNGNFTYIDTSVSVNTTGGQATHAHTVSVTVAGSNEEGKSVAGSGSKTLTAVGHVHTVDDQVSNISSNEPPYITAIFCKANADGYIVKGMIGMFNETTASSSWQIVSDSGKPFYQKFIKGSSVYRTTGGQSDNTHEDIINIQSQGTTTEVVTAGSITDLIGNHTHTINITSFNTTTHTPPYTTAILYYFYDYTPPFITITNPDNASAYTDTTIPINISLNENGTACFYKLDNSLNVSMSNLNYSHFYGSNNTLEHGFHNITFWCNDTYNNFNQSEYRYFTINLSTSTNLSVTLLNPADSNTTSSLEMQFNCSANTNKELVNISLYINSTGIWHNNGTNTTTGTNNWTTFTLTLSNGTYLWNCLAYDNETNVFATSNRSFIIANTTSDTTDPIAEIISPVDNYNSSSSTVYFEIRCNDTYPSYLELWSNFSGSWTYNKTNSTNVASGVIWNVTVEGISDGNYIWGSYCNDTTGNDDFSDTNRTLSVDTTKPIITVITPENNTNYTSNKLGFNVSLSETGSACLYLTNASSTNITMTALNTTHFTYYNSSIQDGGYYVQYWCNDSFDNWNTTSLTYFTINSTDNLPTIVLFNPANNTNSSTTSQTFICNATDDKQLTNIDLYLWYQTNGTLLNTTTNYVNGTSNSSSSSYTFTSDGTYLWNCKAIDNASQENFNAINYTIKIDSTYPLISYNTPPAEEDNSYINRTSIITNVSLTETNLVNITYTLTYQNDSQINKTTYTSEVKEVNFTGLGEYTYKFNVTSCDIISQCNSTATRNVTIDLTKTSYSYVSPTPDNGSTVTSSSSVTINVTTDENADCRYVTTYTDDYESMSALGNANTTQHSATFTLANGDYNYYVRCKDTARNLNETTINRTFTVAYSSGSSNDGGSGGGGGASKESEKTEKTEEKKAEPKETKKDLLESLDIDKEIISTKEMIEIEVAINKDALPEKGDVEVTYYITDEAGNIIIQKQEIFSAENIGNKIKLSIESPRLEGKYKMMIEIKYAGKKEIKEAEFNIVVKEKPLINTKLLFTFLAVVLASLMLIFSAIAFIRHRARVSKYIRLGTLKDIKAKIKRSRDRINKEKYSDAMSLYKKIKFEYNLLKKSEKEIIYKDILNLYSDISNNIKNRKSLPSFYSGANIKGGRPFWKSYKKR